MKQFKANVLIHFLWALMLLACGGTETGPQDEPYVSPWPDFASTQYAGPTNWLCHPDKNDGPCRENLDSTIVYTDGSLEVEPLLPAESPSVDCFYVYPTCSMDTEDSSDLEPGEEEIFVAGLQTARLMENCRVFAPVYRQVTVSGLLGGGWTDAWPLAYEDVLSAFKHYMTHHNEGRGVVLIGHSQGAGILTNLLATEFDHSEELRSQLVSAYIIGSVVEVPPEEDVGGSFMNIPLCREDGQTACVISYATYRAEQVFDERTIFGRPRSPEMEAACTNPADLGGRGGRVTLNAQYPSDIPSAVGDFITGNVSPFADADEISRISTPFFSVPGLVEGECLTRDGISFLGISINGDPSDPRADDIGGDMILPGWGLHMVDVTLLMGDVSRLIRKQSSSFSGRPE